MKDHLRGLSRTIPSFLMAYGDDTVTLETFDQVIPDEVFREVTSIGLADFRKLRDGGEYVGTDGEMHRYPGLFDAVVFNDSVKEFLRLREALLKLLRPAWRTYQLSTLLYNMNYILFDVPGARDLVSYPYIDFEQHRHSVLVYNSRTGEHWEPKAPPGIPDRAVWQTRQGDVALLYARILSEQVSGSSWSCSGRCSWVICLGRDGTERWRFEPEMHREQSLEHIHSSADGVVTLFASGINGGIVAGAKIFQIDGETGKLLRMRSIPHGNEVHHLAYSKELKRFVYCERKTWSC